MNKCFGRLTSREKVLEKVAVQNDRFSFGFPDIVDTKDEIPKHWMKIYLQCCKISNLAELYKADKFVACV